MSPNIAIFAVVFAAALALFGWSCYRRFGLVMLGQPDNRFQKAGTRVWSMLLYAFGQKRVAGRRFGINHVVLFWCFIILLLANTIFLFNGVFPEYVTLSRLPDLANRREA